MPDLPRFEFATATRIIFGAGTARNLGELTREFGRRALVVTGSQPGRFQPILDALSSAGVAAETFPVPGEPTTLHVASGVARAKLKGFEVILGIGGGSAIDAAKAIAGLHANDRDLFDCLEVVGRGQALTKPATPWIAVPTTAGAGAEVTRNAVLTSREHRVKASLRSPCLLARIALVDPELTLNLPPAITAATGLDALTQLIEPLVSHRANPMTDALALEGLRRAARSLRIAFEDGRRLDARTDLALAALHGGLALANAGLGAVHGLAAPIGGAFPAPHGAVCAALLPHVMAINLAALRARAPDSPALGRYERVARELTGCASARAEEGIAWVAETVAHLGIPGLSRYGISPSHHAELAAQSAAASSMKANPIALTTDELEAVLQRAS